MAMHFFCNYITSIKKKLIQVLKRGYFKIFIDHLVFLCLLAFLPLSLSGICVFVGSWRIILWKWLCYVVFIVPHNLLPLWEFLLTLRLSLISQNALMFCFSHSFWPIPTYSVTQHAAKFVTSWTINGIFILKEHFLTCAIASSDRTWLSIGSHNLSPSDMFTYCWATSSLAVRLVEIYRKKNISC